MRLRDLARRLTGRDRIEDSHQSLQDTEDEMDGERLLRMATLEKNAHAAAANFRAAKLYDAAQSEREKADALTRERRRLQTDAKARREKAEQMRMDAIRGSYNKNSEAGHGGAR